MVNVIADNRKLRQRAEGIVQNITGASDRAASEALDQASGNLKQAVLLAAGATDLTQAKQLLDSAGGHLRLALAQI